MNIVERFKNVLDFRAVDRLPMIEWADWWDMTVARWYTEGLSTEIEDAGEIREHLGLDCCRQFWISGIGGNCPVPKEHGGPRVTDINDYVRLKELGYLYPEHGSWLEQLKQWRPKHRAGDMAIWFWMDGFFWFPRKLFGIEPHMYAFYDQPELMHVMNRDMVDYGKRKIRQACELVQPSFMLFAEDLSYNHGPMLSKNAFDEFLRPYYREMIPFLKEMGIIPMIDSDGDITSCVPWFKEVGIEGIGPLERMAGVDVLQLRRDHPDFRLIGGFDKMVMHLGESAMRREFERLLPVMKEGGYLVSVDHQTPPEVSLQNYRLYVSLLREFVIRAGHQPEQYRA